MINVRGVFMGKKNKLKFKPAIGVTIFTLVAFMILVSFGSWQIVRFGETNAVLDKINTRMSKPAVPMLNRVENPSEFEFSRVTLAGKYLYRSEFLIKPKAFNGESGYHVLVPFKRISGDIVMVNRGWVSDELISKVSRPKGIIKIEGIIQLPHRTEVTPENKPQGSNWYWSDLNAMAKKAKLKKIAPVIVNIAERKEGVYPIGGIVEAKVVNNHMQYAAFLYSIAFILLGIFFYSNRKTKKGS